MKSKVTQLSTYDETNSTWRQPVDIGAKAANVDLDIGNGSVRNIQGAIGEYTDSESIAEKIGHIDRTISYANWKSLSEEEKNSGDWYIPDFPVSGSILPMASDFTGATGSTAGIHGLVPAPAAEDNEKFLCGDGTWGDIDITKINQLNYFNANLSDLNLANGSDVPFAMYLYGNTSDNRPSSTGGRLIVIGGNLTYYFTQIAFPNTSGDTPLGYIRTGKRGDPNIFSSWKSIVNE